MRTDVKVGLICAVVVVLCVILYFVAHAAPRPATAKTTGTTASHTILSETPPAPATAPSSAVTGGFIGLPGSSLATTAPATAPATAPSLAGTPTTPDLGAPTSLTGTPTSLTGTPSSGFGTSSSGLGTSGFGSSSFGTGNSGNSAGGLPVTSVAGSSAARGTLQVVPSNSNNTTTSLTGTTGAITYKIQKGDMLGAIAKKFNVSLNALEAANPGVDSSHLKIDAVIKIPASAAAHTNTTTGDSAHAITSSTLTHTTASSSTPAAAATTIKPGTTYIIKKGDTLRNIAKAAYGSKADGWKKIFQANRSELNDPDVVPVGAKIVIP